MTTELLSNYLGGTWTAGTGAGTPLFDPVLGTELVRVDATGLALQAGFEHARHVAGPALRAMGYKARGEALSAIVKLLQSKRDDYYAIATANSGTVKNDSAVDIDGAIYTLGVYAKLAAGLPETPFLADGEPVSLAKDNVFASRHILTPVNGLALFINAFNFPSWGLWEKAAPALLSGVPVVVKPGTATAWLTQRMVKDVVEANILPAGSLNVICGSSAGLLDALRVQDVVSFTGSADTAAVVRSHPAITQHSVRANIEADSINSALLLPGEAAGSPAFDLLVREVVREMTIKSGQKCTAIRRIFVPESLYGATAEAITERLSKTVVGNPRNETVTIGSLVSRAQYNAVREGLAKLQGVADTLRDGSKQALVDADPAVACCVAPTLLGVRSAEGSDTAALVHDMEVFGPVATLVPYRDAAHAQALIARGQGSLVASVYGSDELALASTALALAPWHGRVHVITPDVAKAHSGHGNVMPQSLHGGPGRAGGGEELGGARALNFYHRRSAVQAAPGVLNALG